MSEDAPAYTSGPWEYVPSTEHHGPYITSAFGNTIADFYVMSQPGFASTRNGGESRPVFHMHEMADPNARLAAAAPELLEALRELHLKTVVGTDAERHAALEAARVAITKAETGQ